ncbi:tuberin-like isoform X2 [Hyalella azteca]|uniref:Tuberin-like isoform X2 n=1 Tax=Hyalella azteca TaxID=294128 RepID=A0A8B7P180_HYAAZ|nr:tuberin-like isoform X2 [Hyalella azteca]
MSNGTDDASKELSEKLKRTMRSPDWPGNVVQDIERKHGLQLSPEFMQQLSKNNTNASTRLAAIKRLTLSVKDKFVKEDDAEKLWLTLEDLLVQESREESRNAALSLLTAVAVSGNNTKRFGAPMRHIMLNYVQASYLTVSTEPLFELFTAAVGNGKSLELVEDLIGPFYNTWYPMLLKSSKAADSITLFINLTKTNAAFLDEPELLGLVKQTVLHMNTTMNEDEGILCLTAIETVVAYCHLPSVMVKAIVATLARIVSIPAHSQRAWKLMRIILGTYLGVSALFTICDVIKSTEPRDPHVIRGCVYFLHSALWGPNPVLTLDVPFHFALPVLLQASTSSNELIVYEVAFAIKLLVGKLGAEIHPQAWETVFSIVTNLYNFCLSLDDNNKGQAILNVVNDSVDYMETLKEQDQFCVRRETFFNFLRPFTVLRSESSANDVIEFLTRDALDSKEDDWLQRLSAVLVQHYCHDQRLNIRKLAITSMNNAVRNLGKKRATEVVEAIILPTVAEYRHEPLAIRCAVVELLGTVAFEHNHPVLTKCLKLLVQTVVDPFKKCLASPAAGDMTTVNSEAPLNSDVNQSVDAAVSSNLNAVDKFKAGDESQSNSLTDTSACEEGKCDPYCDVVMAVDWLIKIFKRRMWHLPSSDAIMAFKAMLTFLEYHYANPALFKHLPSVRRKILGLIFQLRANERYEIGMPDVEDAQLGYGLPAVPLMDNSFYPRYTPYIIIDHKHGSKLANASYLSLLDSSSDSETNIDQRGLQPAAEVATNTQEKVMPQTNGNVSPQTNENLSPQSNGNVSSQSQVNFPEANGVSSNTSAAKSPKVEEAADCRPITTEPLNRSQNVSESTTCRKPQENISAGDSFNQTPEFVDSSSNNTSHDRPDFQSTLNQSTLDSSLKDISFVARLNADIVKEDSSLIMPSPTAEEQRQDSLLHNSTISPGSAIKSPDSEKSKKGDVSIDELLMLFYQMGMEGPDGKLIIPSLPVTNDPWKEAQRLAPITYLSLSEAAATVIVAMKREKDWTLLKVILEGIPKMLQNKSLIVSRDSNDIDYFAEALTGLITDRSLNLPASLYNTPEKFFRVDFEIYVYIALSCLSCYKTQLSQQWQQKVVSCLTNGMKVNKCGGVCIAALTLCCLEMPNTMVKSLSNILHSLTKISATVHSSQPVLEFLSTLLHLPHIYCNFSSEEYKAVFAIVIPYTNPIKFNQYVVILSFHVLAMWFLKCKISSRRKFVNFITKNLKNVLGPEDGLQRRRSASLHDQGLTPERLEVFMKLHDDMCRTLTDLMSRYTFASCTPMARRSEVGEALVGSGQQQTWLVGLKLFTITTSGCSHRPMTSTGLCENCHVHCEDLLETRSKEPGFTLDAAGDTKATRGAASSTNSEGKPYRSNTKLERDDSSSQSSLTSAGQSLQDDSGAFSSRALVTQSSQDDTSQSSRPTSNIPTHEDSSSQSSSGQQALRDHHLCTCWCIGYAEVYVRQPTGNMVWMMRLQNHQQILEEGKQLSMDDLCSLYGPSITPKPSHLGLETLLTPLHVLPGSTELGRTYRRGSDTNITHLASVSDGPSRRIASGHAASSNIETVSPSGNSPTAVQRSCSSPEIIDNEAVVKSADDAMSPEPGSDSVAPQSSDALHSAGGSTTARSTLPNKEVASPLSRLAAASATHTPLELPQGFQSPTEDGACCSSPPLDASTPSYKSTSSPLTLQSPTYKTSPQTNATQSPSKFRKHIGIVNSYLHKISGNISSGATSPTGVAAPADVKRLRHSSALSSSTTSTSQPNVSSLGGVVTSNQASRSQEEDALAPIRRGRGHTISVMNLAPMKYPTQPHLERIFDKPWSRPQPGTTTYDVRSGQRSTDTRGGVTPSNVLLQLLYSGSVENSFDRPLLLPSEEEFQRTIKVLDQTPPLENHCLGVLYVGYGQSTEQQILGNTVGSSRYQKFLSGLGTVVSLKKASKGFFLPGLSNTGDDGDECYVWQDEIMQVSFHVATLMPNKPNDPKFTSKKRLIGNDSVTIVYNESGKPYDRDIIKTQFNTVIVEIRPAEHESNTVNVNMKRKICDLLSTTPVVRLVSDTNLPLYVRQMALHSAIACRVDQQLTTIEPYAGNWLCRLRTLKRLRDRLEKRPKNQGDDEKSDFTDFTDMLDLR